MHQGEIVIYQPDNKNNFHLEVRLENDTVWLTQKQMTSLFDSTKQNISLHVNNIFKEGELTPDSTVKEYLTVRKEGGRKVKRKITVYNLDVIISVGYRVKSLRGTQFRIWANNILKEYLLKGYAINRRIDRIEKKVWEHEQKFDLLIKTSTLPKEGIFFNGQIFDAWVFVSDLVKSAKIQIVLIDNYINEVTLTLLSKREKGVKCEIYTSHQSKQMQLDLQKHNEQYEKITIHKFSYSHDRFLLIDETDVYHIGASLKDLGKKWFAFSKIELEASKLLQILRCR